MVAWSIALDFSCMSDQVPVQVPLSFTVLLCSLWYTGWSKYFDWRDGCLNVSTVWPGLIDSWSYCYWMMSGYWQYNIIKAEVWNDINIIFECPLCKKLFYCKLFAVLGLDIRPCGLELSCSNLSIGFDREQIWRNSYHWFNLVCSCLTGTKCTEGNLPCHCNQLM